MRGVVVRCARGGELRIRPEGSGGGLYEALCASLPTSIELKHVKWSGEAIYFVQDLRVPPRPDEMTDQLAVGSVTYYPQLKELILCYGAATAQGQDGRILVGRVGRIEDLEALREIGTRVWEGGIEPAKLGLV